MTVRQRFIRVLGATLEAVVLVLMGGLALVVILGVAFRKFGAALVWYDEVASVLLAWLTFYGAALAALHRAHIGFPKVLDSLRPSLRRPLIVVGEACVLVFFLVMAWAGWRVLGVLGGDTLVSLPWVPQRFTQSVIPIGAVLFILAEVLTLPEVWAGPVGSQGDTEASTAVGSPSGDTEMSEVADEGPPEDAP